MSDELTSTEDASFAHGSSVADRMVRTLMEPDGDCVHNWKSLFDLIADRERRAEKRGAVQVLMEIRDALYRGEGPDMVQDSDIVYGEWLSNWADRIEAAS